ncbi:hypothetical protein ABW21_db0205204 [Orbilia brochopaga]|nr:hypothetical protein ABW21_db0205204 [Drechslerella brochopaga]
MPRRKWIDKKSAQTFQLVHRSQTDPLVYDNDASQMVFKPIITPNSDTPAPPRRSHLQRSPDSPSSSTAGSSIVESTASSIVYSTTSNRSRKIKNISDLESEYGFHSRQNEGEAAMHGIYYDDTEYDYMQHMREIGVSAQAVFIEAPQAQSKQRKHKTPLIPEDALNEDGTERKKTLEELLEEDSAAKNGGRTSRTQLPAEMLPSDGQLKRTYHDQQDIPDTIAGFQPDMDPRLREVLEALEDEAYVGEDATAGEDEGDFFGSLATSGEIGEFEFERSADFLDEDEAADEDDDDGWESDATEKAAPVHVQVPDELPDPTLAGADETAVDSAQANEAWRQEFAKFQKDKTKKLLPSGAGQTTSSFRQSDITTFHSVVSTYRNQKLKKKGIPLAQRNIPSTYSMSSGILPRTEGQRLLDDRFAVVQRQYACDEDDDDESPPPSPRVAKAAIPDYLLQACREYLEETHTVGKGRRQRRVDGKEQTGMQRLDDIRNTMGRPRDRDLK